MDGLNDNFILSGEEIDTLNLFEDNDETQETKPSTEEDVLQIEDDNKNEEKPTTEDEVDPDDLFDSSLRASSVIFSRFPKTASYCLISSESRLALSALLTLFCVSSSLALTCLSIAAARSSGDLIPLTNSSSRSGRTPSSTKALAME